MRLSFAKCYIGAVAPKDGRMLHMLAQDTRMAHAAAVECLCLLPYRQDLNEVLKHAQAAPGRLSKYKTEQRSGRLLPLHEARVDPGFQS